MESALCLQDRLIANVVLVNLAFKDVNYLLGYGFFFLKKNTTSH